MTVKVKPKDKRLQLVAGFVLPEVKLLIQKIANGEDRSESQIVRMLLEESPRIKAHLRRNGKARAST